MGNNRLPALLAFLAILIIPGLIFANFYGPSRLQLEKTWIVTGEEGVAFELDGIFLANDSGQRIVSMEAGEGAEFKYGSNGAIKLVYNGTVPSGGAKTVRAIAVVDVLYESSLPEDFTLGGNKLEGTALTAYNKEIETKAAELSDYSNGYSTLRNLVDWTNKHVEYDISYFGRNNPAEIVFTEMRGVCVEYSHLLISLLNSLGVENRYVAGYVYNGEWQPHSWVEVKLKDGKWLPLDPTFGEIQHLDSSHLAMFYGKDQEDISDRIVSYGKVGFESEEKVGFVSMEGSGALPVRIKTGFDAGKSGNDGIVRITLINEKPEPLFITYSLIMPKEAGNGERSVLLFMPGESKELEYPISIDAKKGFVYTVPVAAMVNGQNSSMEITLGGAQNNAEPPASNANICGVSLFAIGLAGLALIGRD